MARGDKADRPRVLRKDRTGANPVTVGLLALVVIVVACWLAFRKDNPLTTPFKLEAVFQTSNGVRPNMPVRIAGVDVGKVTAVKAQATTTETSVIEMEINPKGLPIHKDAELKIRPRIFLEGNYFIDLKPGTPSQPSVSSGDTIPVTQTATPVQLDQVLTALQQNTREDLQGLLQGFGDGLTNKPTAAENATQDESVKGLTAAQALNKSLNDAPGAARGTAIVNSAIVGDGNDVAATIKALNTLSVSLAGETQALQDTVVNFNKTVSAFADESTALGQSIAALPKTLKTANATFDALNASFPPVRAFAKEILPGVAETQATIDAARPWITQATALLSDDELGGLVDILTPTTQDLAEAGGSTQSLLNQQNLLAQCATKVLLPTGDVVIEDGPRTSGASVYKEFFYAAVGFNGEGQETDGNGQWLRATVGGSNRVETGSVPLQGNPKLYGNALLPPKGTRPAMPSSLPTQNFKEDCKDQAPPNLNAAVTGPADGQNGKAGTYKGLGGSTSATAASASSTPVKAAAAAKPRAAAEPQAVAEADDAGADDGSVAGGLLGVLNPLRGEEGGK